MTELRDRLDRLAARATTGTTLDDPSTGGVGDGGDARGARGDAAPRRWPLLAAAAALVLVVGAALVVAATRSPDEVATTVPDPRATTDSSSAPGAGGPVVSIVVEGRGSQSGPPLDVEVIVEGPGGEVAHRNLAETETSVDGAPGQVFVDRGLIVTLPGPGGYAVRLVGERLDIACSTFDAAAGDRLVYVVGGAQLGVEGAAEPSGEVPCATVTTAEEWAGTSGEVGSSFVGMTEAEVAAAAGTAGYSTRVAGRDGVDLALTDDLVPTRLDLWLYEGVVVAAALGGEDRGPGGGPDGGAGVDVDVDVDGDPVVVVPGGEAAVNRTIPDGLVRVTVGGTSTERSWTEVVEQVGEPRLGGGLVFAGGPGPAEVAVTGPWGSCSAPLDTAGGGVVVTLLYSADGTLPDGGGCPIEQTTVAEHAAGWADGWAGYDEATGYLGLTESAALDLAASDGVEIRLAARDGVAFPLRSNLDPDRVNVVVVADRVVAAARF